MFAPFFIPMPASDQGLTNDRYTLIPRTLIFLTNGDKILLIRGAANKRLWANLYNGIGGHVEKGEDIFSSAKRELLEETGIIANQLWHCGSLIIDTDQPTGIGIFVFKGITDSLEVKDSLEGTLEWVPTHQLLDLPLVEDLPILLPKVLAATPSNPPFFALYTYDATGKLHIRFGE